MGMGGGQMSDLSQMTSLLGKIEPYPIDNMIQSNGGLVYKV